MASTGQNNKITKITSGKERGGFALYILCKYSLINKYIISSSPLSNNNVSVVILLQPLAMKDVAAMHETASKSLKKKVAIT